MFERHFHFHIQPFAEHLPAERLWPDDRLTQGLARLRYLTAAGTLGLVTGASGVGKSALLKRFWHELRGPGIRPATCTWLNSPATTCCGCWSVTWGKRPSGAKTNSWARSATMPARPTGRCWSCWTRPTCSKPKPSPISACWSVRPSTTSPP